MKNTFVTLLAYTVFFVGFFVACDTKPQDAPPTVQNAFKKEDIIGKWKLTEGKVTAPLPIPDIFDATNPLISGNPQAMASICVKNGIIEFKTDNSFLETTDCYNALGTANNPQGGTYIFNETESSFAITYTNANTFPTVLIGRKVIIKTIDKTVTPNKMTVEYKTMQSGLEITTLFTYVKQAAFAKEELTFKWKLTAGKVTAPLAIPDIFDATNPLISGNPQALAALCAKNSVLEFKANNTFTETSDCYTGLPAGNNPQGGTYIFNEAESSITTTYTNAGTFPTVLVGRKVVVKSINITPVRMIVEYRTVQSGLDVVTEFTYQKQ